MKITKDNKDEFWGTSLSWNSVLGGNGLQYMIVTISPEVIGTQHYKYPTDWFNAIFEGKDTFKGVRISGAYHVGSESFSGSFDYIIRDNPSYNKDMAARHGNINGYRCDVQDELKKEFKNLRGMIFYTDSSEDVKDKVLIILGK